MYRGAINLANVNANVNVTVTTQTQQIRGLTAEISRLNKQAFAANSAAAAQQRMLNTALIDGARASGQFSTKIVPISSAVDKFSSSLEKGKLSLGQYTRYAASQLPGMSKVFAREFDMINRVAESRVKKLNTQFIGLGQSANGMQQALALTPNALDQFSARSAIALQRQQIFNRLLRDGSTQLLNWGKNTQWAGRQLMVGFTIPLGIFAGQAAKIFRELEAEVINFKKVYGDMFTTDTEVEQNLSAIRELSVEMTKYGQTAVQTMKLANTAAQAGFRGAELIAATTEATRLAILGQMEQNQAMETTITLQTAFQQSSEELGESINFLNAVENQTILNLQDVSEAIPRVASVIKGFGGDVQDLAVLLVAMKEGGVSAAEGANALKNSMARLVSPTKAAREITAKYGIDLAGMVKRNQGEVIPMFQELAESLEKIGGQPKQEILSTIFGKFQYARIGTLMSNIARDSSQAATAIKLTETSATDLAITAEKELSQVEDSISTKFTAALEKAKIAMAPVGEEFLKALTPVLEVVGNLLAKFSEMPSILKTAFVAGAAIIGGIAPVLLMVVGLVANGIANIGKFIYFLRKQYAVLRGNGEAFKLYTGAELEASAASASLDGRVGKLTSSMVLQQGAIKTLTTLLNNYVVSARAASAALPATMGGVGFAPMRGAGGRGGGFAAVAPKLPVAYRNEGGPIFDSSSGKTRVPGVGNTDTVPAMLTPGEFVINKQSTKNNLPLIKAINDGSINIKSSSLPIPTSKDPIQHAFGGALIGRLAGRMVGAHASRQTTLSTNHALQYLAGAERALVQANPKAKILGLDRSMLTVDDVFNQAMKKGGPGIPSAKEFSSHVKSQSNLFSKMPEISSLSKTTQNKFQQEIAKQIGILKPPILDGDFARAYSNAITETRKSLSGRNLKSFNSAISKTQKLSQTRVVFDLPDGMSAATYAGAEKAKEAMRRQRKATSVRSGQPFYYVNEKSGKLSAIVYNPDTGRYVSVTTDSTRKIAKSRLPSFQERTRRKVVDSITRDHGSRSRTQRSVGSQVQGLNKGGPVLQSSRKRPYARITADRAEMLERSLIRSGGSKSDRAVRQAQNQGVKDGEIRIGKNGKTYNVYNAATGTWMRGIVKRQSDAVTLMPPAYPRSGGSAKEGGLYKRPTHHDPSFGAEHIVGGVSGQPRYGNVYVQRLNAGNIVSGMGNKDTVPAMLTPGEFVVNKKSTQENLPLLRAINEGNVQKLNTGDIVKRSTLSEQYRSLEKSNPRAARMLRMQIAEAQFAAQAAARAQTEATKFRPTVDRAHVVPYGGGNTRNKEFLVNPYDRGAAQRNPQAAWTPQSYIENQGSRLFAQDKKMQAALRSALNNTVVKQNKTDSKRVQGIMTKVEKGISLSYKETQQVATAMKSMETSKMTPQTQSVVKQFVAAAEARREFRMGQTPEAKAARSGGAFSAWQRSVSTPPIRSSSAIAERKLAAERARQARAEGRGATLGQQTGSRFSSTAEKRAIERSQRRQEQKVARDEARRQRENDRRSNAGRGGGGGKSGLPLASADMPEKKPGMFARGNAAIGKMGMGAGMALSMASILPMMGADKETGKWMGMDSMTAMMGLMGGGTLLSILPMLKSAALPVAGVAAAAAAVGFGLYKWRDSVDSAARETAEFGSNLGVAANSVSNMASILRKPDLLQSRKYQQLTVLPGQEEEFASYTQMLNQEGSAGEKFIKELKSATSEERFSKLTDYLRSGIAAELLTVEEAKLFAKAVGAQLGDVILGIRAGSEITGQKTGSSTLMGMAKEREDAALSQSAIKRTIESTTRDSLDASDASMTVAAGTQIIKSYNEVIAKAQQEYQDGVLGFNDLIKTVNSANESITTWSENVKTAYDNVNDFGALLQGTKTSLALAGITDKQQEALNQSYEELSEKIGVGSMAGRAQFSTGKFGEGRLPQLVTESAFQRVADMSETAGFGRGVMDVKKYLQSEEFTKNDKSIEEFEKAARFGKNLADAMKENRLEIIRNQAVAERGLNPLEATSIMNTIAQNDAALEAYIDGGQTVESFMNSIVAANAEIMFSSDKLQRSFINLSGQLDKSGQSEALRAYIAGGESESERDRRLREIENVGLGMSQYSSQNAKSRYLSTKTIMGQYYDEGTIGRVQQSPAYQAAMNKKFVESRMIGGTNKEYSELLFDDTVIKNMNQALDRAGKAGVSGNVLEYAIDISVNEMDAVRKIDLFTAKVKDLKTLDPEVAVALDINIEGGVDVETFGGFADDIMRTWGMLSALNPNIDLNLVARSIVLNGNDEVITDPAEAARDIIKINKAYANLEKASGKQKQEAQIQLVKQYQTVTEYTNSDGKTETVKPEDIINDAQTTLQKIGKKLNDLPAAAVNQIIQLQTTLSDNTAALRSEYHKMRDLEDKARKAGDNFAAGQFARKAGEISQKMGSMAKDTEASIYSVAIGAGDNKSGGSSGGGSKADPYKDFLMGLLENIALYSNIFSKIDGGIKALIKQKDKVGKLFSEIGYKGSLADQMRKANLNEAVIADLLSQGYENAKKIFNQMQKRGTINLANNATLFGNIFAQTSQLVGQKRVDQSRTRGFANLQGSGLSREQITEILADDKNAEFFGKLENKGSKAWKRIVKETLEAEKATKKYEETSMSAMEKIDKAREPILAGYALIEAQFEQEFGKLERAAKPGIKASEDKIKLLEKAIDLIDKEIEKLNEANEADQKIIRTKERQKEMLNRQIEAIQDIIDADQRRIDQLQREDTLRNRVSEALSYELDLMSQQEEKIREAYDKRFKALDKVAKINDHLINQQRKQLDLSRAISEGDIYAATAAAQEMRAESGQFSRDQLRSGLETSMEKQIENLTTSGGLTRKQAEEEINKIKEQSYQTSLMIRDIEDRIYERQQQILPIRDSILRIDREIRGIQDQIYDRETLILGIQVERLKPLQTQLKDEQESLRNQEEALENAKAEVKFKEMTYDAFKDVQSAESEVYNLAAALVDVYGDNAEGVAEIARQWNIVAKAIARANEIANDKTITAEATLENKVKKIEKRLAAGIITKKQANAEKKAAQEARDSRIKEIESERKANIDAARAQGMSAMYAGGKIKGYGKGGKMLRYPMGGLIPYATGGVSGDGGRDSVLAKLTPGEFVVRKSMVNKYGIPMLEALNQGAFSMPRFDVSEPTKANVKGGTGNANINAPVYNNYDMKFAVSGTNASADEIANKVMFKMKQVQAQGIRSNRGY